MYKVRIADRPLIKENREVWDELVRSSHLPSIFCTWDFIDTWLDHFGKNYEPLILFVYEGDRIRGILPLALAKGGNELLRYRVLTYCGVSDLYSIHVDIISSEQHYWACLQAISEFLLADFREWDVLSISNLTEGNRLLAYFRGNDVPFENKVGRLTISRYLELAGGHGDKHKRLLNSINKLKEKGFRYQAGTAASIEDDIKALFDLHEKRTAGKGMESVFKGPRLMEFHIEFAKTCILNNRLWLRFIESPEKKIAATYDFALEGRVFGYQGGMDPEWKSYALGSVLYYLATEEAASKGLTQYDFGGGDEEYKRRWTTMYRRLMHLRVFNKTVRSRIARGYRFASTYDLARSYQDARNFFIKKS